MSHPVGAFIAPYESCHHYTSNTVTLQMLCYGFFLYRVSAVIGLAVFTTFRVVLGQGQD